MSFCAAVVFGFLLASLTAPAPRCQSFVNGKKIKPKPTEATVEDGRGWTLDVSTAKGSIKKKAPQRAADEEAKWNGITA